MTWNRARFVEEHPAAWAIGFIVLIAGFAYMAISTRPGGPAGKQPGWQPAGEAAPGRTK